MEADEATTKLLGRASEGFEWVEHAAYMALGGLLSVTALLGLLGAVSTLWHSLPDWDSTHTTLLIIDRLLFVLMVIEILHTVRASMRSGQLTCEPFLVVGLIATIRRVLVITLRSSETTKDNSLSEAAAQIFRVSMLELVVLALLIIVMVVSIRLTRPGKEPV